MKLLSQFQLSGSSPVSEILEQFNRLILLSLLQTASNLFSSHTHDAFQIE